MQLVDGRFVYSASDLSDDLDCIHLGWLERRVALRESMRPEPGEAERLVARKGEEHERRQLERFRDEHGAGLVVFSPRLINTLESMRAAEAETVAAMRAGAKVIAQATFFDESFVGRADFLRRIERPSRKWAWSYEVVDTKLALSPKPHFVLQLCHYSEHLARVQGTTPELGHLILGSNAERSLRIADYAAYYRRRKGSFLQNAAADADAYPAECGHCAICRWQLACEKRRDGDDYLGIVARMRGDQIEKFETSGIRRIEELAGADEEQRPYGMQPETFRTLRAQAALQHRQRQAFAAGTPGRKYFYDLLPHEENFGLELMPQPDPGDVFFDIEGDPLYAPEQGLEYLFGIYLPAEDEYRAFWARRDAEERVAFEALMDFLVERRATYPAMHVYHYAPYETTALRRLMGRYATRERELDHLLRSQAFVDLYTVVRQALRISQPSYSIKKLEAFYGMQRSASVTRGDDSIVQFELWLSSGDDEILHQIQAYNEEDCRSTHLLREWLLSLRPEQERLLGRELSWRAAPGPEPEEPDERDELARRLLDGLPPAPRSLAELRGAREEVRGRWLLGHALAYHRREAKPAYWKLYDRYENVDRLEEFDHEAIGGLRLCEDVKPRKYASGGRRMIYTYEFPDQQHHLGSSEPFCPDAQKGAGKLLSIDDDANRLEIVLNTRLDPAKLRALIPGKPFNNAAQRDALRRIASAYLDGKLETDWPATADLLLARIPRLRDRPRGAKIQPQEVNAEEISRAVRALDGSYLVVQGPPGTGKSTKGAAVIVDLLEQGSRVAVMARSHKPLHALLAKVEAEAERRGAGFAGLYKSSESPESEYRSELARPMIENAPENPDFGRPHQLAAGTPWLFAREERVGGYDYLFIDEAGQLALADVLACAPAARNVVLLGDPLQLAQVSQGSHPLGTDLSILEHLLGSRPTIPVERGIFLDVSYRMHPSICEFVSTAVYERRLGSSKETGGHRVDAPGISGSGLRYLPVAHRGNGRASDEEARAIVDCIGVLMAGSVTVESPSRPMTQADIVVVTPYNAQKNLILRRLAAAGYPGVRVGTVDKFQGQEAPVVFYSMATSSGDDIPRDMAFLFERNRLNVAISRAQAITVLVCSPQLLEVGCKDVAQMALANLLCAYVEVATLVEAPSANVSVVEAVAG